MSPALPATTSCRPPQAAVDASPIVVGVSGGVDSAVALARLREAGHELRAVFMKNWDEDDAAGECPAARDLADARAVCAALGVPLGTVNLSDEYWERVFLHFLDEYRRGRTPNPDVLCNQELKYRAFLDHARGLGATRVATGHYARVEQRAGVWSLLRGADEDKDQTYFLHRLDQSQLAAACFPLGALTKSTVRGLARELGLAVHDKRDSTGICFIGKRPFRAFLARYVEPAPGPIRSVTGERLGEHDGLAFYTIGQRAGLGIGGRRGGKGEPWYVARKDTAGNVLLVAQGREHPALWHRELVSETPHWIAGAAPARTFECHARIRHRQPLQACRVTARPGGGLHVRFRHPQWAVAPGQSIVLYRADECLGGAVIETAGG